MGGNEKSAAPLATKAGEEIPHPAGVPPIETRRRLVGDEEEGTKREGAGDRDPLLFAARERVRPGVHTPCEPDRFERLAGAFLGVLLAAKVKRKPHVLDHVEERKELDVLKNESEMGEAECGTAVFVERVEILFEKANPTRTWWLEPRRHREERRLARTGHAEDGRPLSPFESKRDPL